ncbi:MAG: rod shape-determining protein RodA [Anaerolineae bacterium]|nr:MAG: rod shape-determining protein RodA [Anaerolineae bacterium]
MQRINWRHFDFWLLGSVILLIIFGVVMIRSAIAGNIELLDLNLVQRQLIFAILGLVVVFLVTWIDYHTWAAVNRTLYVAVAAALAVLYVVGSALYGSARWFDIGFILIQPSEIAKIVVILALGNFFARNQHRIHQPAWIVRSFLLTMGIAIWILLQPDLSTSIVLFVIWFALLWVSGLPVRYVLITGGAGLAVLLVTIPLVFNIILNPDALGEDGLIKPYQVQRVRNFLFTDESARYGEAYNVEQALTTIGSGGLFGQGYGQNPQVQNRFLKVRQTDFIYAVMAGEFGFVGTSLVTAVLLFVIWRCLVVARKARDTYGALIAIGVATLLAFHAMVNVGMNLKLLPVTGLPLPFISYGGSSLLSMMLGIGLVESVAVRQKQLEFEKI